jgi:exodeoxyribonuclease VII small subunit
MKMDNNTISYKAAFDELQSIVQSIEAGQIGVDELSQKVSRAIELIRICKSKLHETENNVSEILKDLEEGA